MQVEGRFVRAEPVLIELDTVLDMVLLVVVDGHQRSLVESNNATGKAGRVR